MLATVFSAEPEIAQMAQNHDESSDKSKYRLFIARSSEGSDQEKRKSQYPERDHGEILMTFAAEKYGDDACGDNQQKHQLVKNLFGKNVEPTTGNNMSATGVRKQ